MRKRKYILLAAFGLWWSVLYGQEPDSLLNADTLASVSVSAHRLERSVVASNPTQEMQRPDIQAMGMTGTADVLRRMAGVGIKDYGGIGGMKTVSVRNMGAQHTMVAYDGVAVSNCQAGQIDIGRFSLAHLQSLSLSVGHQDDLLLPARLYSSAAILSLNSMEPAFAPGRNYHLNASCKAGSWGEVEPALYYARKIGERTQLRADVDWLRSDGCYPYHVTIPAGGTTREHRKNSDVQQWHAEANLRHQFRQGGELSVKGYGYGSERGLPGYVIFYNNQKNKERLWDRNAFLQSQYKKSWNGQWTLLATGKYNYAWDKYRIEGEQYSMGYAVEDNTQHEGTVSAAVSYAPTDKWQFSLAQDEVLNTLQSKQNFCPDPVRLSSFTALNARFQTGRFRTTATCVCTYLTESVSKGTRPDDILHLSPSLSVRYTPFYDVPLYLRAMYKNTFRAPNFNDLYYRNLGNIYLKPEDAQELSAGITTAWGGRRKPVYGEVTVDGYWGRIDNKIVAIPANYVWNMRNYGQAQTAGIDATLKGHFWLCEKASLHLSGSYSWMKAIDLTDPNGKSYRNQLPYTPKHSGNLSAQLKNPWVTIGYSIVAVGLRYMEAQNIVKNEVHGYQDHTLTLSREFQWRKIQWQVIGSVTNLLDKEYDVIRYYPMPGRAWHLTIEMKL